MYVNLQVNVCHLLQYYPRVLTLLIGHISLYVYSCVSVLVCESVCIFCGYPCASVCVSVCVRSNMCVYLSQRQKPPPAFSQAVPFLDPVFSAG